MKNPPKTIFATKNPHNYYYNQIKNHQNIETSHQELNN